jgi:SET domain-containing protein
MDNTIDAKEEDYLYIQKSQIENSGNGLFTAIEIYKEEIISIFKGKIITNNEAESIVKLNEDKYFINLLDGTILDSNTVDCFAKYANDSNGFIKSKYKNNSKITLDESNNVCLVATKNIKSNEEIFCSYGKRYWKKHG